MFEPNPNQIMARWIGRIAFGGVLIAGVMYLVAAACSHGFTSVRDSGGFHAARIISLTWVFAVAAAAITRRIAARVGLTGDLERLFAKSLVVPTIGIALLLPITLHMPVALLIGGSDGFDAWVIASIVITGAAHAVFAGTSARRAYQLVAGKPAISPRAIVVATVLTSCVPFAVLCGIPPALVAITALPFVLMLRAMDGIVARERLLLEVA